MSFENWLQSRLTSHGFPVGTIDGVLGRITRGALEAFQRSRGLRVTGNGDTATVEALRRSSTQDVERPSPSVPSNPVGGKQWPLESDLEAFYGKVGVSQVRVEVPWDMRLAWDTSKTIRRISLHRYCAESASRVFGNIADTYSSKEISDLGLDMFGGSLNVRRIRGGSRMSTHSWGISLDFDPARNRLRSRSPDARLSHPDAVPFWECWENEGWVSLGRTQDYDWMHVQAARRA